MLSGYDFSGKVVFVTGGGGGGIGPGLVRAYARLGATVAFCDKRPQKVESMKGELAAISSKPVLAYHVDVADRGAVGEMLDNIEKQTGGIDIFIANATEVRFEAFHEYAPESWDRIMEVDLTANFLMTRKLLPGMITRGRGNILYVGTVASYLQASDLLPGEFAYVVAKDGLRTLTRVVAAEGAPHGIRCNSVALGLVESPFTHLNQAFAQTIIDRTPLKRAATNDDVTKAILFLTSEDHSSFVTGESLCVSGGLHMRI